MPKKPDKVDHNNKEKLAKIRKRNVERHAVYENMLKLRQKMPRRQRNAAYDMELQRLKGPTVQGHAHKWVADLKNILGK